MSLVDFMEAVSLLWPGLFTKVYFHYVRIDFFFLILKGKAGVEIRLRLLKSEESQPDFLNILLAAV